MTLELDNYSKIFIKVSEDGFRYFSECYNILSKDKLTNEYYLLKMYFNEYFKQQGRFYLIKTKPYQKKIKSISFAFKDAIIECKENNDYNILFDLIENNNKSHFWSRFLEEGLRLSLINLETLIETFYNRKDMEFLMGLKRFNTLFSLYFRKYYNENKTRKILVKTFNDGNTKTRNYLLKWINHYYLDEKKYINYILNIESSDTDIQKEMEQIISLLKILGLLWHYHKYSNEAITKIRLDYLYNKNSNITWIAKEDRKRIKHKIYFSEKIYFIMHRVLGLYLETIITLPLDKMDIDDSLRSKLNMFLEDTIYWLNFNRYNNNEYDIVLEEIIHNIYTSKICFKINLDDKSLFNTITNRINIKEITNLNLVSDAIILLYLTCANSLKLYQENCDIIELLVNSSIKINSMEECYRKYHTQYCICLMLINLENINISIKYLFEKFIDNSNDNLIFKKFSNGLMDNIIFVYGKYFKILKENDNAENIENKKQIADLFIYLLTFFKTLYNLICINSSIFVNTEIKSKLSIILNSIFINNI